MNAELSLFDPFPEPELPEVSTLPLAFEVASLHGSPAVSAPAAPSVADPPALDAEEERSSLYRRYRSRTFGEVAGQPHVTQTLRNAVRDGKVAHAYLFTGPRGTGKTSTARILARAANCLAPLDGEPCNRCAICSSMLERRSMDLIEIDAASNNSVDDVRELRERVSFRPAAARRKVFIIDEVHMLSTSAFNALLKTLEEPPDHVLFALATTDIQKVPATVTSRCQVMHLRAVAPTEMLARLQYVCEQERIGAEEGVLQFVGAQSTGSLRDALSLLEQIRAYCGDLLRLDEVEAALGVARTGQVEGLAGAMAAGDLSAALLQLGELVESGIDARQLARQLAGFWREALVARARGQKVAEAAVSALRADGIAAMLRSLLMVESLTRRSDSPRWALELAVAEATLAVGGPGAPPQPQRTPAPRSEERLSPETWETARHERPAQVRESGRGAVEEASVVPPMQPSSHDNGAEQQAGTERETPMRLTVQPSEGLGDGDLPSFASAAEPVGAQPRESITAAVSTEQAQAAWTRFVAWFQDHGKRTIAGYLSFTSRSGVRIEGGVFVLGFPASRRYQCERLDTPANRTILQQAIAEVLGVSLAVRCDTIEGMQAPPSQDDFEESAAEMERLARERRRP